MNPEGFGDRQYHNDLDELLIDCHESEMSHRDAQIKNLKGILDATNRLVERYQRAIENWERAYSALANEQQQEADGVRQ